MSSILSDAIGLQLGRDLEREAQETSMIVLVGATGSGKSHFINAIVPDSCVTSARLDSCTQRPASIQTTFDGKRLVLIDTPGFNDTRSKHGRSDAVILSEIARLIAIQSTMGVQMKGILYLHDILSARMTGDAVRQLELLKLICGENCWDHVTFVTTKWPDEVTQGVLQLGTKESDLRRKYWRGMLLKKAKMFRFDNTKTSAETIIRSLMHQPPVQFALQQEMSSGKILANTAAGRFVVGARQRDEERQQTIRAELKLRPGDEDATTHDVDGVQDSINNRKKTEKILEEDVEAEVKKDLRTKIKEFKDGNKLTAANVISILIGLSSLAVNIIVHLA